MPDVPFKLSTTNFDPTHAEVTLQYTPADLEAAPGVSPTVQGKVLGPYCVDRATVIVSHPLQLVKGSTDILRARIPDPCFWSPELPFLYRLEVEVQTDVTERYQLDWGIQSMQIHRSKFQLNNEIYALRGVKIAHPLTRTMAERLRQSGVNLIVQPMKPDIDLEAIAACGDTVGMYIVYEIDPDEEAMLWQAETELSRHISTLGYLLPQATMQHPQLWHNAMMHLHRQRRDTFIGIQLEHVPLDMVQGHVEFMIVPVASMEAVGSVKVPKLASVRRFDALAEELPTNLAGRVSRVLPAE